MVCVSPSHTCRLRAPLVLRRGAFAQPWMYGSPSVYRPGHTRLVEQAAADVVVVEELREDVELSGEELVGEVDGGVHDAHAVRADGVGHVADADGVQRLARGEQRRLDEHLPEESVCSA